MVLTALSTWILTVYMTSECHIARTVDQHAASDDIAAEAAMFRLIVENTVDIIFRYNAARARQYVSPACREMLGYEPAEMLGINAGGVIHPDDFVQVNPDFLALGPDRPHLKLEFRVQHKDGHYVWVETHHRYVSQDGGAIAVMRDITDRKNSESLLKEAHKELEAANDVLRYLAQQDGLTGLANRRRFDEMLQQEFRRAVRQSMPLAVLLIDVDYFKAYNDRYGHSAGDDCLRRISRAIESSLRTSIDHAARYGGEEFCVLLPDTDLAGAVTVGRRMCEAVSALAIEHLGSVHRLASISIGVSAMIPHDKDDPARLVEHADRALYQAKSDGRNRVRTTTASTAAAKTSLRPIQTADVP